MVALTVNTSPRMTLFGTVRMTKKGWKALRVVFGASPNPTGDVQNVPACHLVMESGTVLLMVSAPD